ncbi:M48 family metalloprotease [Sphingomonas montana]|uniref:M48 family metalloprotease n=1 Tax=Sphingomonas montana TaxID=1843236 RepID=UPI0009F8290B|nr:M48 family metalloprotease [Sphingomonas montana]
MKRRYAIATFAALVATAGYGVSQTNSISASDKATGAKANPQLLAEYGGTYAGPQAAYVTRVGRRIAVQSGLSNSQADFTIALLNSPVNNAFAIPGGYVYVTRQLTGLMNDEAELASVLGHEVGHVAARHSQKRESKSRRNSILGTLGQVLVGAVAGDSGIGQLLSRGVGTGAQLLTLRYSRSQEIEADDLGIRYLAGAGYDPYAASTMLASLQAQTNLDAQTQGGTARGVPAWASTHPDPGARVDNARKVAERIGGREEAAAGPRGRDAFLAAIDGILYGDDPAQGVVEGTRFVHPALRIAFTAPQGFALSNGTQAVTVSGTGGQAQFAGGAIGPGGLPAYIDGVLRGVGSQAGAPRDAIRATTINGFATNVFTTTAQTQSGSADVTVVAYQASPTTAYHFVTITPAGQGLGPFGGMVQSMARLTATQAAAVKARRIRVVTVGAGDTIDTLARRMAYADRQRERFLVLNALEAGDSLTPGSRVKLVVYG